MDEIKKSILNVHGFTPEQVGLLLEKLTCRTLQKGDHLLKSGQSCSFLAFIEKGSLRYYTWTKNDELTLYFFTEYAWLTDYESLVSQTPSQNYIQALEPTELKIITLDDLHIILEQHPAFRNLLKLLDQTLISSSHLKSVTGSSPDERYQLLLKNHPEWVNRFPQMHIASYLGMTKETFSRVKSRVK